MKVVETHVFIGGPADGETRVLVAPLPLVEVLEPRPMLTIAPEDYEGPETGGSPNIGTRHHYRRCQFHGTSAVFAFYLVDGMDYDAAIAALFGRYAK